MFKDLIEKQRVVFKESVGSWEEAIREAALPLLRDRVIEESYIDAMIRCIHEFGPYIIIAPDIAIPHARSEFGVHETSISFMKTETPVSFGDGPEYDARLLFVIASAGNDAHIPLIESIVTYLSDESVIQELLAAKTADDLNRLCGKTPDTVR